MAQDRNIKFEVPPEHFASLFPELDPSPINPGLATQESSNDMMPPANTRLADALTHPPLQSDSRYAPSKLRRFFAALAGGLTGAAGGPETGMKVGEAIRTEPYKEAYQDWLTKTGALEKGATLDIKRIEAERSGMGGLASLLRAQQSGDVNLQGQLAGAKAEATDKAKKTPQEKNYEYYMKTIGEDETPLSFKDFLKQDKTGVERNTSLHLSVKDAREQDLSLNDRDGKPIDTSKLPDNMEYRMMIGGPNGPYWTPDTQATKTVTQGNVRSVVPALTPQLPITSGEARTPTETSRETRSVTIGPNGEEIPVTERLNTTSTPSTTGFKVNAPSMPNSPSQLGLPTVLPPGQRSTVPSTVPPTVPSNTNTKLPNNRRLNSYSETQVQNFRKYSVPATTAVSNIIGNPNLGVSGLDSYADIADNKESMEKIATFMRTMFDNVSSSGGGSEEVGANIGAVGANINSGGLWTWFKNVTGLTKKMTEAQNNLIQDQINSLNARESEFAARLIAAAGDVAGIRSLTQGGAYKWSVDRLKLELPVPGFGLKSGEGGAKAFKGKLAAMLIPVEQGLRASNVPDEFLQPYTRKQLQDKIRELNEQSLGRQDITKPKRNIKIEEVK